VNILGSSELRTYIQKAEAELREDILPFWMQHVVDRERGGFHGQISNDLVVDRDASRGALLCSRILWTYSAAYRLYHDPPYLETARWAYHDLLDRFWDEQYGGLFWEIAVDGTPLRTRKQIYGQAFGIYGLSEYYRATGDTAALNRAIDLFHLIQKHSYDPEHTGYLEAYTREWQLEQDLRLSDIDMNVAKSMNTHLHITEAFTNLMRTWNDEGLRAAQTELLGVMIDHIVDVQTYHTILFFDEQWRRQSDHVSYGHDIEASWLLVEAAEVLGDEALLTRTKVLAIEMARATLEEGLGADGGLNYESGPDGFLNTGREWWPQAEAVVGLINAYQLSGEESYLEAAFRSWDFIEAHLVDREHGEWFRAVTRDGQVRLDEPKVSFWKCPYHNARACMETIARLRTFL